MPIAISIPVTSTQYSHAWTASGLDGRFLSLDGHDHFSILEELASPTGKLTAALVELVAASQVYTRTTSLPFA